MALKKLHELGFKRLGLSGGGRINGAFLREGLIDEFSVVMVPVAVGGIHTPTIFDCPDLVDMRDIVQLDLIRTEKIEEQLVWMYYKKSNGNIKA